MKEVKANDLGALAQAVWALPKTDIEGKKQRLHVLVDNFKFKDKQEKFHLQITKENNPNKLDKLAADLMLADTDKVIKI